MNSSKRELPLAHGADTALTDQQRKIVEFLHGSPTAVSARRVLGGVDVRSDTAAVVADLQHLIELGLVCTVRDDGPNIQYGIPVSKEKRERASNSSMGETRVNVSGEVRRLLEKATNPPTIDEIHAAVAPDWDRKRVAAVIHTLAASNRIARIGSGASARYTKSTSSMEERKASPSMKPVDLALATNVLAIESLISARRGADRALRERARRSSDVVLQELAAAAQSLNDQIDCIVLRAQA